MKFIKRRRVSLSNIEVNFFIVLWSNFKETLHYLSHMVSNIKKLHLVLEQCSESVFGTQGIPFLNICVMFFSNKKLHYNRVGQQFFKALCRRTTSSLQKRKHHQCFSEKSKKKKSAKKYFFDISLWWRTEISNE